MLKIKTYLDKSSIEGLGLFADEDISEGTIIWEFTPGFDIDLPMEGNLLSKLQLDFINKYAYFDMQLHNWILCADDDRFTNHSDNPNTGPLPDGRVVALRDIEKDEEIIIDYYKIDEDADLKLDALV